MSRDGRHLVAAHYGQDAVSVIDVATLSVNVTTSGIARPYAVSTADRAPTSGRRRSPAGQCGGRRPRLRHAAGDEGDRVGAQAWLSAPTVRCSTSRAVKRRRG